jgi:hypothetical protein
LKKSVNCEGKNGIGEQGIEIVHCSVVWWYMDFGGGDLKDIIWVR